MRYKITREGNFEHPASFWHKENGSVICDLCPHSCILRPGSTGICNVRECNDNGELVSLNYGAISSLAMDPVEKKPLFHWKPGNFILSAGSIGCNMKCQFCQNWQIATCQKSVSVRNVLPNQLADIVLKENTGSVAFTYNEPFVSFEYIMDCVPLLRERGIDIVLVTNGMINEKPLNEIIEYIDAVNIDLKAFTRDKYSFLGGDLDTVLGTIAGMYQYGVHTELTNLVVTDLNDIRQEFEEMIEWISSLSPFIPFHISRYFPSYKWNREATAVETMDTFTGIASEKLAYVYNGNMQGRASTFCRNCGRKIIERDGYSLTLKNLDENGFCAFCKADNGIVI